MAVDGRVGVHVYRIIQEALNNVARHAGTRQAWLRLAFAPDALEIEIEDRGKGFSGHSSGHGIGMVAMRERAQLLGGTIEFVSPEAGGMLVRLHVPIVKSS